MTKLTVIDGTKAPDTAKERVRARLRKTAVPGILQCPRCAGRELIEARTNVNSDGKGGTRVFLCVLCLASGERIVVR